MSLLKVFMQDLRFLDFYRSNDPKLKLELRKLAKFWAVWNLVLRTVRGYGADSPPFMRLVHQRLCREVVNRKNTLRTVRQRTADGPLVLGRICQRQCQSGCSKKKFKGGRSARVPRTVREWTGRWGRPDLTYIGWSNLFWLVWNLVCMPYTYGTSCCTNFMRIWWEIL